MLAAFAAAPTADAGRGTLRDARGDAGPAWDITRVVVDHGPRTLTVEVRYRSKLRLERPAGLLTSIYLDFGHPSDSSAGDIYVTVVRGNETEGGDGVRHSIGRGCKGLKASVQIERRRVVFRIPQRCFGGLVSRLRVSASTYKVRGSASEADSTSWSRWIQHGPSGTAQSPTPREVRRCRGKIVYGPSTIKVRKVRGVSCGHAKRLARGAIMYRVENGFPDNFCQADYCWRFSEATGAGEGLSKISFTGRRGIRQISAVQLVT